LALPPCFAKASSAARKLAGLSYSNTGGFIGLPSPFLSNIDLSPVDIRFVLPVLF
jgi:hypothetical protein